MLQHDSFSELLLFFFFCTAAIVCLPLSSHEVKQNPAPWHCVPVCSSPPTTVMTLRWLSPSSWYCISTEEAQTQIQDSRCDLLRAEQRERITFFGLLIVLLLVNAGQRAVRLLCHKSTLWLEALWGWPEQGGFPTGYSSTTWSRSEAS